MLTLQLILKNAASLFALAAFNPQPTDADHVWPRRWGFEEDRRLTTLGFFNGL